MSHNHQSVSYKKAQNAQTWVVLNVSFYWGIDQRSMLHKKAFPTEGSVGVPPAVLSE